MTASQTQPQAASPGATPMGEHDAELLQLCANFLAADAKLDQIVADNDDDDDDRGSQAIAAHRQWRQDLQRALLLPATTSQGERAKTTMLLAAMSVIFGTCPHRQAGQAIDQPVGARGK